MLSITPQYSLDVATAPVQYSFDFHPTPIQYSFDVPPVAEISSSPGSVPSSGNEDKDLPFAIRDAVSNAYIDSLAVSLATNYTFPAAAKIKYLLANPHARTISEESDEEVEMGILGLFGDYEDDEDEHSATEKPSRDGASGGLDELFANDGLGGGLFADDDQDDVGLLF